MDIFFLRGKGAGYYSSFAPKIIEISVTNIPKNVIYILLYLSKIYQDSGVLTNRNTCPLYIYTYLHLFISLVVKYVTTVDTRLHIYSQRILRDRRKKIKMSALCCQRIASRVNLQ